MIVDIPRRYYFGPCLPSYHCLCCAKVVLVADYRRVSLLAHPAHPMGGGGGPESITMNGTEHLMLA